MKRLTRALTALLLALLTATLLPLQVFADTPDYISEVKVFEGSYDSAEKEGYTILKDDDGKAVNLNRGSGSTDIGAKGNKAVPSGYKTGIHMFGEKAALNLNDKRFCWNQSAKSVMVYYKTDSSALSATGSNFNIGTLALAGGTGALLGAAATAFIAGSTFKKKRE